MSLQSNIAVLLAYPLSSLTGSIPGGLIGYTELRR